MPKFSVRGIWQRWRESYPNNGSKNDEAITVFTGVRFYAIYFWFFRFMLNYYLSLNCSRHYGYSILLDYQVPTMYTRLLQGYDGMDPEQQSASSFAAKQLRLMVSCIYILQVIVLILGPWLD